MTVWRLPRPLLPQLVNTKNDSRPRRPRFNVLRYTGPATDTSTAFVLFGAIVIGMTRLRGSRRVRIGWNVMLAGYFGLVTGNLISLAVVTGWAAQGFAWRLAPGMAAVLSSASFFR